ncbi:MAG: type III secretion protein, partial [Deltaproteobacteria bacterium]|nr:type III secretion protein [Deltaproteobacteria bacterium]
MGARRVLIALTVSAAGCGSETVVHRVTEKDANQIIEVLHDEDGIQGQKVMIDTGRDIFFNVVVPSGKKIEAIKTLNKYELPRRADRGYGEVFEKAGMIPTNAEERAKGLAALEGEVERQLKLIDGILDAQVQVVVPQESALRTTREQQPETTASVTIKCMPAAGGSKPVDESVVKRIVANGVEKLVPERVE